MTKSLLFTLLVSFLSMACSNIALQKLQGLSYKYLEQLNRLYCKKWRKIRSFHSLEQQFCFLWIFVHLHKIPRSYFSVIWGVLPFTQDFKQEFLFRQKQNTVAEIECGMGLLPLLIASRKIMSKPVNASLNGTLNICGLLRQKNKLTTTKKPFKNQATKPHVLIPLLSNVLFGEVRFSH